MTIVHFLPAALPVLYPLGGAIQRRVREIARTQVERGDRVIVYSAEDEHGLADYKGVEIRGLKCRLTGYLRTLEYLARASHDVRNVRAEVLHFHSLPEGTLFTRSVRARKVLSYDNYIFRRGKRTPLFRLYQRALDGFGCLLPVSEYCLRESVQYWRCDGVPMRVVHNGVNLEQFRPDPCLGDSMRTSLGIRGGPVILYVGRVCTQKGSDVLCDAFASVRSKIRSAHLVVAGPAKQFGEERGDELTERIREVGGLYLGPVAEEVLCSLYNACDLFVLPTREWEMFGMVALEAQACGKPVVATLHGGLPEVIGPTSGALVAAGDANALANKIHELLTNADMYLSMVRQSRENSRRFGWEAIAAELDEVYRTVARRR